MASSIVLIGPANALPSLRERLSSGAELQTFTDAEALQALEHIIRTTPTVVALEHEFSATPRGTALIDRIKADPALHSCEIRVIAHDGMRVAGRVGSGPHQAASPEQAPRALDPVGTRRAPRIDVADGLEILIDGNTASIVNLSVSGVQVLSAKMLKPNQRVRVVFFDTQGTIRCNGSIVWASFEMPKGLPTRYRAGIELSGADAETLRAFAERHKRA